jgi:hypothetical protein
MDPIMSNNPILPIVPNGGAPVDGSTADDEDLLPANNDDLDEGETTDSQDTVDKDVHEADSVNEKLDE